MMKTDGDRLGEALRSTPTPPGLGVPTGQVLGRVKQVRRRRTAITTTATIGGLAALALAVPAAVQLLPENVASPAGPGPVGQERVLGTASEQGPSSNGLLPGMPRVTSHTDPVTSTHTGTSTVELGDRPEQATGVSTELQCLSAGRFTWPDGASMDCEAGDSSRLNPHAPYVLYLPPGQEHIVIEATDGASWRITTTYVSTAVTPWGVNANGDTYGVENEKGTPDLIAVQTTDGTPGYVYATDLQKADGPKSTSAPDPLTQQWGTENDAFTVPVYQADGDTVIGEFLTDGSSTGTADPADVSATTTEP